MPRSFPGYRRHKASGQAVVTLNGRDFYLGTWSSPESRIEYQRFIGEWLANGRQLPHDVRCGDISVAELLAACITFAATYYVRGRG